MKKKIFLLTCFIFITSYLKGGGDAGTTLIVECVNKQTPSNLLTCYYQLRCKEIFDDRHEVMATLDFSSFPLWNNIRLNVDKLEFLPETDNQEQPQEKKALIIRALLANLEIKAREKQIALLTLPPELHTIIADHIKEFFKHKFYLGGSAPIYTLLPDTKEN